MIKIAYRINNLTDARYFAAHLFDWIIIDPGPGIINSAKLQSITDWLSGVNLGMTVYDTDQLTYLREAHPEITGLWLEHSIAHLNHAGYTVFSCFSYGEFDYFVQRGLYPPNSTLDAPTLLDLSALHFDDHVGVNIESFAGICLAGGEEIRAGFKDFQALDHWIEWMDS